MLPNDVFMIVVWFFWWKMKKSGVLLFGPFIEDASEIDPTTSGSMKATVG